MLPPELAYEGWVDPDTCSTPYLTRTLPNNPQYIRASYFGRVKKFKLGLIDECSGYYEPSGQAGDTILYMEGDTQMEEVNAPTQ